jgi:hypothetical protein
LNVIPSMGPMTFEKRTTSILGDTGGSAWWAVLDLNRIPSMGATELQKQTTSALGWTLVARRGGRYWTRIESPQWGPRAFNNKTPMSWKALEFRRGGRYWTRIPSPQWGPTSLYKNTPTDCRSISGGRYWTRTNDLCDVNATL